MLANGTSELKTPVTWWDDLVHSMSFLPFHYCCLRDHFLHESQRSICLLLKYYLPEEKKKKSFVLSPLKAKILQKKPKNSGKDLLQFSLPSYCNFKSIAPSRSDLVFSHEQH